MFRFAGLGYAVLLTVINRADYARLGWAWVHRRMTAWTVATTMAYAHLDRVPGLSRSTRSGTALGLGGSAA